jgi:hypothetical protein
VKISLHLELWSDARSKKQNKEQCREIVPPDQNRVLVAEIEREIERAKHFTAVGATASPSVTLTPSGNPRIATHDHDLEPAHEFQRQSS